jgi:hypothetical protein
MPFFIVTAVITSNLTGLRELKILIQSYLSGKMYHTPESKSCPGHQAGPPTTSYYPDS